ncbi:type IV secretory system conjugative DNA transfer family protein [Nitrosomonas supralitoralis]|uniref:Type IV secretion system protein VirD4 n=1 Tax=Nitrosomonas supralitoralis TaxID=2116706 RepID=A0A2P7NXI8_9PROT|nr:type IV secretory system conjugative DNA transfer family protein [Nitrosomonas supralitoralis]PSJ18155.1 hypothetical protein C7H79_04720 [Nitrosomonas supralitoralis]
MRKNVIEHTRANDVLATARWGEPDFMAQLYPYKEGSFWLGRNPHNPYQALGYNGEGHVFLAAGSGSGKGRSIIINNLIKWPGSLVSIDPKGINAAITAIRRGQGNEYCDGMGQDVYVLDPMNCADVPDELRAHYNLLDALDPYSGDLSAQADLIADAVCVIPKSGGDSAEWAEEGREFISIIIQWVVCSPYIHDKDRNLLTVKNLIMEGEYQRSVELQKKGINVDPYQILLDDMKESKANSGRIARQARNWQQSVKDLKKYYESIRISANRQLKFLNTDGMENTVSNTGVYPRTFRLSELRASKKGISIYLCLPPSNANPFARWQKAMIHLILAEMQKYHVKPDNGHDLLISIDEFPILGHMEKIIDNMNYIRESGVKLFIACQHLSNLKDIYGDNFEQFIAGAKLQIWFSPGGKFTGEYLSQLLGETEIIKYQRSITEGRNSSNAQATTIQNSKTAYESTAYTKGTNTSQNYNSSHTDNRSFSHSRSNANSTGKSNSWSKTSFSNKNWQHNNSSNWGISEGKAAGRNYGPHIFFESFEHATNYNNNSSNSKGGASGSGYGGGSGNSDTFGGGSTFNNTKTYTYTNTDGSSDTQSYGNTIGQSNAETVQTGTSNTDTIGYQHSNTHGESSSAGVTETFHKKPLLTVHEAEHYLKTIENDKHDAYPGLALIKIQGELPFLIRRINYDQDSIFERCFNPHPSHPYLPYSRLPLLEYEYTEDYYIPIVTPKELLDKGFIISPIKGLIQGQFIEKNMELFGIKSPYSGNWRKVRSKFDIEVIYVFELNKRSETGEAIIVRHREKFSDPIKSLKEFKAIFLKEMWKPILHWGLEEHEQCKRSEDKKRQEEREEAERKQKKLKETEARVAWQSFTEETIQLKKDSQLSMGKVVCSIVGLFILYESLCLTGAFFGFIDVDPLGILERNFLRNTSFIFKKGINLFFIFSTAFLGLIFSDPILKYFIFHPEKKRELDIKRKTLEESYGKNPIE